MITKKLSHYLSIARVNNWTKNLSMLVGAGLAYLLADSKVNPDFIILIKGFLSLCLSSSANYTINEYIDAKFDKYHPIKHKRAGVKTKLSLNIVIAQYLILAIASLGIAYFINLLVVLVIAIYLVGAWIYNIPPARIKDIAYADVILESVNYPLRILVGWFCVLPALFPPSSAIIIAWSVGAFMMSVKRYAEYKLFKQPSQAAAYRKSYKVYDERKLILSSFIYGILSAFSIAIFLLKYRIEFILIMPLLSIWFTMYLGLGLKSDKIVIYPEKLLKQRPLVILSILIGMMLIVLTKVDLQQLHALSRPLGF